MSTRDAMVISAAHLFRERGVAATSLRDVVEAAGAPRGSIYHHFPGGKAQLAQEATVLAANFIERILTDVLAEGDSTAAIEKFVGYWERVLLDSDYTQGCPVAAAALSGDDTAEARTAAGDAFQVWEARITDALRARGLPTRLARDRATLIICAIEGALMVGRARRTTEPLRQVGRQLRGLVEA